MAHDVICLRPEADFLRIGVTPPATLSIAYRAPADADVPALCREAKVMVVPAVGPKIPVAWLEGSAVKLVQFTGAGVDRVDEAEMKRLGIAVANVPGGSNSAMAEYTVVNALNLMRKFVWADGEIKAGRYEPARASMVSANLPGLEGRTVGVIGLGVIGQVVAQAFQRFGANIVYFDPAPRDAAAKILGATSMSLHELLKISDVVTLHVPLFDATRNLISEKELAMMKKGAILIQASRGGIVDETALAASLTSSHLGGAAVDVYSKEPAEPSNPLLALKGEAAGRILFTPHIAGVSLQAFQILFRASWENAERVILRGEAPLNRLY
ncbi:MAG: NAD(P)-dependent oxidoreductase, partial [Burkholderiales bacterium]